MNNQVGFMKYLFFVLGINLFAISAHCWTKTVQVDKMTDTKFVQFGVFSKNKVFSSKKAALVVAVDCSNSENSLYLSHPWIVGKAPVQLRLDKEEIFSAYAKPGNDKKTLVIGDSTASDQGTPEALVKKMLSKKSLVVQYSEAGGKLVQAEFKIDGLDKRLVSACK